MHGICYCSLSKVAMGLFPIVHRTYSKTERTRRITRKFCTRLLGITRNIFYTIFTYKAVGTSVPYVWIVFSFLDAMSSGRVVQRSCWYLRGAKDTLESDSPGDQMVPALEDYAGGGRWHHACPPDPSGTKNISRIYLIVYQKIDLVCHRAAEVIFGQPQKTISLNYLCF